MAHDDAHARAIHELGNESGIVVPLTARGRTFGAITFGTVPPQPPFSESDLELAVELGRRASAALDNALLFSEAEARARASEALEFVDDGVFLVDRDGIVRLWNPAAAHDLPRSSRRKAIGRRVDERDRRTGRPCATASPRRRAVAPASRRAETLPDRRQGQRALALDLGRRASPAAPSTRSAT